MTTNDGQYVPSDEAMENRYVLWLLNLMNVPSGDREAWAEKLRAEFRRGLARVRRDAEAAVLREAAEYMNDDQDAQYLVDCARDIEEAP